MTLPENVLLLRLFVGKSHHVRGKPLYEQIVRTARELNLSGGLMTMEKVRVIPTATTGHHEADRWRKSAMFGAWQLTA